MILIQRNSNLCRNPKWVIFAKRFVAFSEYTNFEAASPDKLYLVVTTGDTTERNNFGILHTC
jgi:hypothetical protein